MSVLSVCSALSLSVCVCVFVYMILLECVYHRVWLCTYMHLYYAVEMCSIVAQHTTRDILTSYDKIDILHASSEPIISRTAVLPLTL